MKPKDKELIRERIEAIFSRKDDESVERFLTRLLGKQRENDEETSKQPRQCL